MTLFENIVVIEKVPVISRVERFFMLSVGNQLIEELFRSRSFRWIVGCKCMPKIYFYLCQVYRVRVSNAINRISIQIH